MFIGIDPDSAHTALAIVSARGIHEITGGGSRKDGRPLCEAPSVLKKLSGLRERWPGVRCAVERQSPRGLWSESCEGVALVHGMWRACCELARVPYTGVLPVQWLRRWAELAPLTGPLRGSRRDYHQRALMHCPSVQNEDQTAALGVAVWLADLHKVRVPLVLVDGED